MTSPGNLLCVANFPSSAGYAWQFIEALYAGLADTLAPYGVRTWVAYPMIDEPPVSLQGSRAESMELDVDCGSLSGLVRLVREVRRRDIRILYLSDRASWHPGYAVLRLAGVRRIVVHDHTSGARAPATGAKGAIKGALRRFRPAMADVAVAVSEYVGRRKTEVDLVPEDRVRVLWNSVPIPERIDRASLRREFGIPADRPVIACACRAAEYKGIQHLLRAFDQVAANTPDRPVLIYFGDGPYMLELESIRQQLDSQDDVVFAGYRPGVADLLGGADVCVVPSVWAEAFGLAALEPAAREVAVVATRTGGLPEVVVDGETGLLVPPADSAALAEAIERLLANGALRRALGRRARKRAEEHFARSDQIERLGTLFRRQLALEDP